MLDEQNNNTAVHALKQSNIFLRKDALIRNDKHGNEIAVFKLGDIINIRSKRRPSYFGVVTTACGVCLLGIGVLSISPSSWAWAAYVPAGLLIFFGLIMMAQPVLVIEVQGDTYQFEVLESFEDLRAFVYSADQHMKTRAELSSGSD